MSSLTYEASGVDPEKADAILESFSDFLKTRPKDPNLLSGIGPYASCYSLKNLIHDMQDPLLVTCCDGVGTKSILALQWNHLDGLGQDLLAMNVNDLLCMGALPTVFLDYYACGALDKTQLTQVLKSIQKACELSGCSLAGGETAEMPGLYKGNDFDLAGFAVGFVDRKKTLPRVKTGDVLLALPSSGPHSNGYSLIRKVIEQERLQADQKNPFDGRTWKETLLAPTHIYVAALRDVLPKVTGLAHLTGGGLFGNLPRILSTNQKAVVMKGQWPSSPLFDWLKATTRLADKEFLSTFNAGVGMIVACEPGNLHLLTKHFETFGFSAPMIGQVEKASQTEPFVEWR